MTDTPSKNYPKEVLVERMSLTHKASTLTNNETVTDFLAGQRPMFERLTLYESIFRSFLSGAVLVHDKEAKGIKNVFSPGDVLDMTLRSPGRGESDPGKVYDIKVIVFKVESMTPKESPSVRGYVLHFASPSYSIYNQIESDHVFDEFFGKIAKTEASENFESSFLPKVKATEGEGGEGVEVGDLNTIAIDSFGIAETVNIDDNTVNTKEEGCFNFEFEKQGFANYIIKEKLAKIDETEYEIEGTKNSIWYRQFFPLTSAKLHDYKTETIHSIMSESKNFAQNESNPYAVNYYFWQDLDGYHYTSVENLIGRQEQFFVDEGTMIEKNRVFVHAPDITQQPSYAKFNRINTMKVTQYVDMLNLLTKGAFGSIYRYWMKPRFDLVDQSGFNENEINFEMSREEINYLIDKSTYSYFYPRDRTLWKSIESSPIISQTDNSVEIFKPSLTNVIRPQLLSTAKNDYEHGYNILDDSPLTNFYNHYIHTDLDICTAKDIMFIQKAMTEPTEKFYNYLTRKRIWDYKKGVQEMGCGVPISYSFYSNDETNNGISPDTRHFGIGLDPPFEEPTTEEIVEIAASIPDECSLMENILGDEWLGCATRDYWYYGSLQRSTPTARKKSHTNAELSYFKDLCAKNQSTIEALKIDGESDALNWKQSFPGLFSEGPLCTCPCQNSNSATVSKNFYKYMEYTNTFSRYWNTDHWVPLLRNAQHQLFKSQQLQFSSSGNLQRKPGEMIYIHLPIITAQTDVEVDLSRGEVMQGKYIITSIKHQITSNNEHTMQVEVCRDGFTDAYSSVSPDTMGNAGMINTSNEWIGGDYEGEVSQTLAGGIGGAIGGGIGLIDQFGIDGQGDPLAGGTDVGIRTLDKPGYLHPEDYSYFGNSTNGESETGSAYDIPGWLQDNVGEDGGLEDVPQEDEGDTIDNGFDFINIKEGKTVAQLYKESLEEEAEVEHDQSLDFVSSSLTEGCMQNFSRYDWSSYGLESGHIDVGADENGGDVPNTYPNSPTPPVPPI